MTMSVMFGENVRPNGAAATFSSAPHSGSTSPAFGGTKPTRRRTR